MQIVIIELVNNASKIMNKKRFFLQTCTSYNECSLIIVYQRKQTKKKNIYINKRTAITENGSLGNLRNESLM